MDYLLFERNRQWETSDFSD